MLSPPLYGAPLPFLNPGLCLPLTLRDNDKDNNADAHVAGRKRSAT
jgi:hypothetical protein